jgi:hypothetical protein
MLPLNVCSNEKRHCTGYAVPTMCRPGQVFRAYELPDERWFPCTVETPVQCFSNEVAVAVIVGDFVLFGRVPSIGSAHCDLVAKKSRYHTRRGKV